LVVMERFSIVTSPDWRMKAWLTSEVIMVSWAGFIPFPDPTIFIAFVIVRLSLYAPGATWIVAQEKRKDWRGIDMHPGQHGSWSWVQLPQMPH